MAATNPDLPKTGYHASYSARVRTSRTAAGPPRRPASTHAGGTADAIQARTSATTSSTEASDGTESSPSASCVGGVWDRERLRHQLIRIMGSAGAGSSSPVLVPISPTGCDPPFGPRPRAHRPRIPSVRLYILSCRWLGRPGHVAGCGPSCAMLGATKARDRPAGAPVRIRYTHAIVHFWFPHCSQGPLERKSPSKARPHAEWGAHRVTRPKLDLRGRAAPRHAGSAGCDCPRPGRESDTSARSAHRAGARGMGHQRNAPGRLYQRAR